MNAATRSVLIFFSMLTVAASACGADGPWTLASPDGNLTATFGLLKPDLPGYPADKARLYYRIERGREGNRVEVLPWSPLGITRRDESFVDGLVPKGQSEVATIDETYRMPHGKRSTCHSLARQQIFSFENAHGAPLAVTFRVANDGVAFRYEFPGSSDRPLTVAAELTGFRLPPDAKAWITPYQEPGSSTPAYEEYYLNVRAGAESPSKVGWGIPALFQLPEVKGWILLAEAAVDATYCGSHLAQDAPHAVYSIQFPDAAEACGRGAVEPSSTLPWTMPWRVIMISDTLAGIVESTLITDLNPPSKIADTSWIKPGRCAWSWWSDHDSPRDYRKLREFVDLAAQMHWEYVLVDANWTLMDHGDVRQLARYAKEKGVGLFLWYNSGGDHNIVSEKPRGAMNASEVRHFEFSLLRSWGVKGVKVDFFQSDKQSIMALYLDILRDAAAYKMMVNFHGCTEPHGWERTWPNLMTMEGVRGAESYFFTASFPQEAPRHNTILPFTRNVVGPMDYTPCTLSDARYPHLTTHAHDLALAVIFESGLLHPADRASVYRELPEGPKKFLQEVPAAWDDIRFLSGQPGQSVVLARRHGKDWYLGAINGQNEPLDLSVPLEFLGGGNYQGLVITDGKDPRSLDSRQITATARGILDLHLLPRGGAAVQFKPQ